MRRTINRLPPLNSLRAFVVAAKHLSFSKAANELNVTPAAVSQQIKQLEDHLGCPLFRRGGRTLILTDEGQACLPGLVEGFESLLAALAELDTAGESGPLTVSVAPSFASKWLVPRLDDFRVHHPDIDVRITATMHLVDFDADDVDCAIRYGAGGYPGLISEKLLDESVVPVCAPSLLAGAAPLRVPADLARYTLLHDDSPDQDPSCPDWRMWLRAAGVDAAESGRGLRFNQSSLVLEAAAGGHGVALAKTRLAAEDLRAGKLVSPFGVETPLAFAYFFVCPPRRRASRKVAAFRDWMAAQSG
ncbi:MAG: transcriptional regulator GcvA [Rhodospirillales bacterium]|nr:MAG: transcriptional regulator GcvA [Rhodospirillales bacterium]